MTEYERGKRNGQWAAFDRVLSFINSIDTQGKSATQVRSELYHQVMDMRPQWMQRQ